MFLDNNHDHDHDHDHDGDHDHDHYHDYDHDHDNDNDNKPATSKLHPPGLGPGFVHTLIRTDHTCFLK